MTEARQCDKCLSLDRHRVNRALSMQIAVTRNLGTVVTARILREEQRLQKTTAYLFIFPFFFSHSGNIHKQIYSLTGFHACKLWQNNYKRFRKNFQKVKLFLNSHSCVVLRETHAVFYFHCSSLQVFSAVISPCRVVLVFLLRLLQKSLREYFLVKSIEEPWSPVGRTPKTNGKTMTEKI